MIDLLRARRDARRAQRQAREAQATARLAEIAADEAEEARDRALDAAARTALLLAAEYIERHGWIQGRMASPEGLCAIGALSKACDSSALRNDIYFAAVRRLRGEIDEGNVGQWNDQPGMRKEFVVAALRKAARLTT
jgi:hypothetical protein